MFVCLEVSGKIIHLKLERKKLCSSWCNRPLSVWVTESIEQLTEEIIMVSWVQSTLQNYVIEIILGRKK